MRVATEAMPIATKRMMLKYLVSPFAIFALTKNIAADASARIKLATKLLPQSSPWLTANLLRPSDNSE